MEKVLDAPERTGMLFFEDRNRRIGRRQSFLEIRRTLGASGFGRAVHSRTVFIPLSPARRPRSGGEGSSCDIRL